MVARSTYRQGDLSTFGDFFREDSEEIQDAGIALGAVAKGLDHRRQDVVPVLHLDR
jgi:hypothetical protein